MPDCVLRLRWENQYSPAVTTQLLFPRVFKSVGSVDAFNSPQVLGLLSKLFKVILVLNQGKEDSIAAAESPVYPAGLRSSSEAGLTIPGRIVFYHTVLILRPSPGYPTLHVSVVQWNSPGHVDKRAFTHQFSCSVGCHWSQRRGGYAGWLRMAKGTVSAGWLQWEGGLERMTLSPLPGAYRDGAGGPLVCYFFSSWSCVSKGKIWKERDEIKFLVLFNQFLLPFLHICQHTLTHPSTKTPPDKSWGGAL